MRSPAIAVAVSVFVLALAAVHVTGQDPIRYNNFYQMYDVYQGTYLQVDIEGFSIDDDATDGGSNFGVFLGSNDTFSKPGASGDGVDSHGGVPFDSLIALGYSSQALVYWEAFPGGVVSLQENPITTQTSWVIIRGQFQVTPPPVLPPEAVDPSPIAIGDHFYLRWSADHTQWATGADGPITTADFSQATIFTFLRPV